MGLRSFRTPDGGIANVWDVSTASERRTPERRRGFERRGQDLLLYQGPERRTGERRKGRDAASFLPPEYASGWLVFECCGEKRRIAPPPRGWEQCSEAELVDLWHRAKPISGGEPRRTQGGGDRSVHRHE
jgi:hypothetical protein